MSLKVYYITTPDVALAIDHEDSHGDDSVFQPGQGENLTFRVENQSLEYGTPEYQELAKKLKLPDFKGMNLQTWREKFSPSPYLAKGKYTIASPLGDKIYIVGERDCRLQITGGLIGFGFEDRGIPEYVDKGCDSIADSAATIYKNGDREVHWEGDKNSFVDRQLEEAVKNLASWAIHDRPSRSGPPQSYGGMRDYGGMLEVRSSGADVERLVKERIKKNAEEKKIKAKDRLDQARGKVKLDIFFKSNSAEISPEGQTKLDAFIEQNKNAREWLVEGYCDQTASPEYNFDLGNRRAQAVADYLREKLRILGRGIKIVSYGESRAGGINEEQKARDRRVTLLPDTSPLLRALVLSEPSSVAPAKRNYLFDASASMTLYQSDIKFFPYPRSAKIFSFNDCGGVHPLENISEYSICGGTPLWISVLLQVEKMKRGEILTVVTDGMDTSGDSSTILDEIIRIAKEKRIKINMINVDVSLYGSYEQSKDLIRVAQETGGMHYLANPATYRPTGI